MLGNIVYQMIPQSVQLIKKGNVANYVIVKEAFRMVNSMSVEKVKDVLKSNRENIAFIIGNGINRYPNDLKVLSWDSLLLDLWYKVSNEKLIKRPNGISTTEFFDVLDLENKLDVNLKKEVSKMMNDWQPLDHHHLIVKRILELDAPLLTTNFEETFAKTTNYKLYKTEQKGFTDFYPWTTYHGSKQLEIPTQGFGIWYINGMINYHRSIRLGLSDYMGSVERARRMIHNNSDNNLFRGKNQNNWAGHKTWMHILFNKSLFIFGLGLEENETFLRWILIERYKYFKMYPDRKYKGWYLTEKSTSSTNEGKKFFLNKVGIEVIELDSFSDIYEKIWD